MSKITDRVKAHLEPSWRKDARAMGGDPNKTWDGKPVEKK